MRGFVTLLTARDLANNTPTPWEKYLPEFKSEATLSPTQVQKNFGRIICTFGTPAKPPKRVKKAPGRKTGDKQTPRIRYPVIQKSFTAHTTAVST